MAGFKGLDAIKNAVETHASGTNLTFFGLVDDQYKAEVRFLHQDDHDLDIMLVHEIQIGGKKRYVECFQTYEQPCALCEQQFKASLKIFVSMYVIRQYMKENGKFIWKDVKEVQLWERGRDTINRLLNLINKKKDLRKHTYEVLRSGKKGDSKTSYDIDPFDEYDGENPAIEDLPTRGDIYQFVQKWTYEQMKDFAKGAVVAQPVRKQEDGAPQDGAPEDGYAF